MLKPALSYDEQIDRLIHYHKLEIDDRGRALTILESVNYYRLSGYGIGLKKRANKEQYVDGTSIEMLYRLYSFDSQIKHMLLKSIEHIEIGLRAKISHHIAITYGAEGLMYLANFRGKKTKDGTLIHSIILNKLKDAINRRGTLPVVRHHKKVYEGRFPVWVAIDFMTFGALAALFNIMKKEDQKAISSIYGTNPMFLKNWILCLVEVRNISAHYMRLYNLPLKQTPQLYRENLKYKQKLNKLFPVLLVIRRMLRNTKQWELLRNELASTLDQYKGVYRLDYMGFPNNWEDIL